MAEGLAADGLPPFRKVSDIAASGVSASAVMRETLRRVRAYEVVQPEVWISRFSDAALMAMAEAVEARVAAGEVLPLAGVPFAVKDNIDVAGLQTTAGCSAFATTPAQSARVVARLVAAGAIPVGKTNLDQFATGLVGTRSPYGACRAVHNRAWISGGSSSGSAVAVAAGLVPFALGTDTAGSGRVPAALNGLFGFKPTKGRWSTAGLVPACRSLDCISIFTHDAADAALLDGCIAGFDAADDYSREGADVPLPQAALRLAIPLPSQLNFLGDAGSARLWAAALERVRALGAVPVEVDIAPLLEAARLLYEGPWVAERTAAVEPLLRSKPQAIHPVVRGIVQGGLAMSAMDAFRGEYALKALARRAAALFGQVDALLLPTCPTSYRVRELLAEPLALNANMGLYTNFVNLLDMAAIAVPAGFRANATGFGVSFIAPAFTDRALLALAAAYQEIAPMPDVPPLDVKGVAETVELAVVGAHLAGMPLHWQLTSRGAELVRRCRTAPAYRLFAIANSVPPKPALVHGGSAAIEVEVYRLPVAAFGSFVVEVPAPLAIGTVELEDGTSVKGFVAEPRALDGAADITDFGGWRGYIRSLG
ncbi:allophanate hydrolase [Sandaracinobacter neustonicus]|uniref:Allophanate hydrolase n=1 Tax=Sandaracinobacter neustonicus TaxID=1715348 RepID=A0A501XPL5_9SPHN|nr:allophanate hydrolase [Sandaracinobacter neustonicus]TPE62194.1 allophanate hydrolase [Sandaracinobacter neustonicus]